MLSTGDDIAIAIIEGLTCSHSTCLKSRHGPNTLVISDEAEKYLHKGRAESIRIKDMSCFLTSLETIMQTYIRNATPGHSSASKVKAHRDLMRTMVCKVFPRVQKLRRQLEGCLQARAVCGDIDSKIEELNMRIYGRLPRENNVKIKSYFKNINKPGGVKQGDIIINGERIKLILDNLDGTWYYIRSFGRYYDDILQSFGNAMAQVTSNPVLFKTVTDEMEVGTWAMRRLDVLEEKLLSPIEDTQNQYCVEDAREAFTLVQILYNVNLTGNAFNGVNNPWVLFVRQFGQEYLWKEIEGAIDQKAGETVTQMFVPQLKRFSKFIMDSLNRPVLLLRPCAQARSGGALPSCRTKESFPNEFERCPCKRMVYCSDICKMVHGRTHATACEIALSLRRQSTCK